MKNVPMKSHHKIPDKKLLEIDILDSKIMVLDVYGEFTVFDLNKNKSIRGKLAKTKDLTKIELSRAYFLVAEYSNSEIVFYNKKIGLWLNHSRWTLSNYINLRMIRNAMICLILLENRSGQKKRKKFLKIYSMWLVTKY